MGEHMARVQAVWRLTTEHHKVGLRDHGREFRYNLLKNTMHRAVAMDSGATAQEWRKLHGYFANHENP